MMLYKAVIVAALSATCLLNVAHAGRQRWPRPRSRKSWKKLKRSVERHFTKPVERGDEGSPEANREESLKWLSSYAKACELAGREKRPLMMLFTSKELFRSSPRCRFTGDPVRRAVRKSGVVPLKVLPPKYPEVRDLSPEEAEKRRKAYAESHKRYLTLTGKFRVNRGPALVFAGPDGTVLLRQTVPLDSQIIAGCWKVKKLFAEQQREQKKEGEGKPDAEGKAGEKSAAKGAAKKNDVIDSKEVAEAADGGRKEEAGESEKPAEAKKEDDPARKAGEPVMDPEDF
jgi:hypothetical protein